MDRKTIHDTQEISLDYKILQQHFSHHIGDLNTDGLELLQQKILNFSKSINSKTNDTKINVQF